MRKLVRKSLLTGLRTWKWATPRLSARSRDPQRWAAVGEAAEEEGGVGMTSGRRSRSMYRLQVSVAWNGGRG